MKIIINFTVPSRLNVRLCANHRHTDATIFTDTIRLLALFLAFTFLWFFPFLFVFLAFLVFLVLSSVIRHEICCGYASKRTRAHSITHTRAHTCMHMQPMPLFIFFFFFALLISLFCLLNVPCLWASGLLSLGSGSLSLGLLPLLPLASDLDLASCLLPLMYLVRRIVGSRGP